MLFRSAADVAVRYTQAVDALVQMQSKATSLADPNCLAFHRSFVIFFAVKYIKGIRNEYYVASTVKAVEHKEKTYDLFLDSKFIDVNNVDQDILLKSIQTLVPSQRLIFNLHVIDNYSLAQASELLDSSEQSMKANLEKARFNLQKTIERNLKLSNDEQPV